MITELKPTNLIAVEVAQDASNYRFESKIEVMYDTEDNIWQQGDFELPPIISYKILGEVTKDKIGFDVEPYVKHHFDCYRDYTATKDNFKVFSTGTESFYSLLADNGRCFENPLGKNRCNPKYRGYCEDSCQGSCWESAEIEHEQWQSFEENLIKGKLLILEINK